ncbi:hypothetical protein [Cryobacterium sp. MLB-32]|uniref:hypothetical protein n=1 Tax=Cryobacterium sp. MLB-32 TaxID=1529318 RepID=UPI0012E01EF5|nr:hypothetical protein [Cryobacterium sp. MLB-32]
MAGPQFLLTLTVVLGVFLTPAVFADVTPPCGAMGSSDAGCPEAQAVTAGGQVQVSAHVDTVTDGQGGSARGGTGSHGGKGGRGGAGGAAVPVVNLPKEGVGGSHTGPAAPTVAPPAAPCATCTAPLATSVSDLVGFSPQPPSQTMEPNGLAIVGLAANFVAAASVQVVSGALLGTPADVRFTPATFHRDFGDGAVGSSTTGGATWEDLGVPEFSDTDTSHIYRERGDYVSTLSVAYSAEFRVGGGDWQPVTGTLAVAGNPLPVAVRHVKSVLVAHDCIQNPSGVGC